ncbi:hypothetical protein B9Z55_003142 [Caenorhabditis nigoni]|uniref:Decapping nuclease n=1 Tax=Caenorhabditis nigoni TaxID=1611254 RepID=A0A2G5VNR3_9PELO|nr:hypothetical protein B9Z55_003142 [Caenorhabditis nigoni]
MRALDTYRHTRVGVFPSEKRERKSLENSKHVIKSRKRALAYTHGANYAYYLTKKSEDETIPADFAKSGCKAVQTCDISIGNKKNIILYSAEIDALDELNQHIELKAIIRGTEDSYYWKYNICTFYWKMFFGGCSKMIIGDKTGPKKAPGQKTFVDRRIRKIKDHQTGKVIDERTDTAGNNYPAFSVCKIEVLKIEEIFENWKEFKKQEPEKRANLGLSNKKPSQEWTIEKGKERVRHFFSQVKRICRNSDCILAEPGRKNDGFWNFEKVDEQNETIHEFVKLVKTKMDIWKTNFSN